MAIFTVPGTPKPGQPNQAVHDGRAFWTYYSSVNQEKQREIARPRLLPASQDATAGRHLSSPPYAACPCPPRHGRPLPAPHHTAVGRPCTTPPQVDPRPPCRRLSSIGAASVGHRSIPPCPAPRRCRLAIPRWPDVRSVSLFKILQPYRFVAI
jgi:hypothetical protein